MMIIHRHHFLVITMVNYLQDDDNTHTSHVAGNVCDEQRQFNEHSQTYYIFKQHLFNLSNN